MSSEPLMKAATTVTMGQLPQSVRRTGEKHCPSSGPSVSRAEAQNPVACSADDSGSFRGMGKVKSKHSLLIVLVLLGMSPRAHAQAWSGILDPSRAADWSAAGVRGVLPGNIPIRTTICKTLSAGAAAADINSAIAACPSGQVVFLNAGTYNLSDGLVAAPNVTLRGAGPDQTFLVFTGSNACGGETGDVCVGGPNLYWSESTDVLPGGSHAHSWTGGYSKGTTQITVDSTSGLSVGMIIILDQANDTSDNGQFAVCDLNTASPPCSLEGGSPGRPINGVFHTQEQYVQITAINGTTLTISPGLYASNWSSAKSPGIFWTNPITGFGIESLSMDHTNSTETAGVSFVDADSCWISNIRSVNGNRNHIWLYLSSHITVRDSYFYGTKNSSVLSYGVEYYLTGDDLIINNIFQHIYSSIMSGPAVGVVTAYNYGVDFFDGASETVTSPMINLHDTGIMFDLYEGNVGNEIRGDVFHGSTDAVTSFRNYFSGTENISIKTVWLFAVNFLSLSRYMNVVGNVVGTAGVQSVYENYTPQSDLDVAVFHLGYGNSEGTVVVPDDTLVRQTLMRWGNYDTVNQAVQWNSAEVPSGLSQYANAVPSSHVLPASFYFSSKPNWWPTAKAWPPIGPDVTGGNMSGLGGFANTIPAQDCYLNVMQGKTDGTSGLLTFNANASGCYPHSTPPNPPTNLSATVQ